MENKKPKIELPNTNNINIEKGFDDLIKVVLDRKYGTQVGCSNLLVAGYDELKQTLRCIDAVNLRRASKKGILSNFAQGYAFSQKANFLYFHLEEMLYIDSQLSEAKKRVDYMIETINHQKDSNTEDSLENQEADTKLKQLDRLKANIEQLQKYYEQVLNHQKIIKFIALRKSYNEKHTNKTHK